MFFSIAFIFLKLALALPAALTVGVAVVVPQLLSLSLESDALQDALNFGCVTSALREVAPKVNEVSEISRPAPLEALITLSIRSSESWKASSSISPMLPVTWLSDPACCEKASAVVSRPALAVTMAETRVPRRAVASSVVPSSRRRLRRRRLWLSVSLPVSALLVLSALSSSPSSFRRPPAEVTTVQAVSASPESSASASRLLVRLLRAPTEVSRGSTYTVAVASPLAPWRSATMAIVTTE
mmetsp:Transcript_23106/g.40294  ORF Transcript_23106/g.40294 Transcript_23106/m.40294 type:complete len:241 (+) Transcript_23106:4643-5365(+)